MNMPRLTRNLFVFVIGVSFLCCKHEEIILHMDIAGTVTDALTGIPVTDAFVRLLPPDDTTTTIQDGTFIFKNLAPGNYEIKAFKSGYTNSSRYISADEEKTYNINFVLDGAPIPSISKTWIDFGFDSTSLRFTVSNKGIGKLTYLFIPSQEWITVNPLSCDVTDETDIIDVKINRMGLQEMTIEESINIISVLGTDLQFDTIKVYLNGIMDTTTNYYYSTVKIGTQIWMKENLKTTRYNDGTDIQYVTTGNDWAALSTPAYCWNNNSVINKDIYGGLYNWYAVNTGKLCPSEWHVASDSDWKTLENYLMYYGYSYDGTVANKIGKSMASDKLWAVPITDFETGAVGTTDFNACRNSSNFTALPGGKRWPDGSFDGLFKNAGWWSSGEASSENGSYSWLGFDLCGFLSGNGPKKLGLSVRCVKD